MQRSASRGGFGGLRGEGAAGFFTGKNGLVDKQKLLLVGIVAILVLWVVYDTCCHLHEASLNSAVHSLREQMKSDAGGDSTVGGVLRSPGSPSGALPESSMFSALDQSTSFVSEAGVLAFPFEASHFVSKQINSLHIATLLPGRTRGNHLHERHPEVIVLVHGAFLLRVASIGNEGQWVAEDHVFEIGLPANPFRQAPTTVSSSPLALQIPPHVCHALRNVDQQSTAFFASYYVQSMDAKREEPNRDICRNNPVAFLKP